MRKWSCFEQKLLLELAEERDNGITLHGNLCKDFNNVYGIAHGGYLYTISHIAAQLTGELAFGGKWDVQSAECLYLHPLRLYPVRVKTVWVNKEARQPMLRAEVSDSKGALCFQMNAGLKPALPDPDRVAVHTPTIITDRPLPKDPDVEPQFPCLSSTFSRWLDIYSTSKTEETIVYSADLTERSCDEFGYLHPTVMFTAADSAAGGCLFYIDKRRPITVSATIHYFDRTCVGPVHAVPRPIRKGRVLNFYDLDLIDGRGKTVAAAQFVIRDMDQK